MRQQRGANRGAGTRRSCRDSMAIRRGRGMRLHVKQSAKNLRVASKERSLTVELALQLRQHQGHSLGGTGGGGHNVQGGGAGAAQVAVGTAAEGAGLQGPGERCSREATPRGLIASLAFAASSMQGRCK